MALLRSDEITNWYLYGQASTPTNLADSSLIRPSNATSTVNQDVNEFMTQGAGRFAVGSSFTLIQNFFEDPNLSGGQFDIDQLRPERNLTGNDFIKGHVR
jgi:hypothetical protein